MQLRHRITTRMHFDGPALNGIAQLNCPDHSKPSRSGQIQSSPLSGNEELVSVESSGTVVCHSLSVKAVVLVVNSLYGHPSTPHI